jgi:hypothetical protein
VYSREKIIIKRKVHNNNRIKIKRWDQKCRHVAEILENNNNNSGSSSNNINNNNNNNEVRRG